MANLDDWYLYSEVIDPDFVENLDEYFRGIVIVCRNSNEPFGYITYNDFGVHLHRFLNENGFELYETFDELYKEYNNNLTLRLIEFK